jgi:hypothetical protein
VRLPLRNTAVGQRQRVVRRRLLLGLRKGEKFFSHYVNDMESINYFALPFDVNTKSLSLVIDVNPIATICHIDIVIFQQDELLINVMKFTAMTVTYFV